MMQHNSLISRNNKEMGREISPFSERKENSMDEYSKAILDAIKIVVDRANNELARDLTV